MSGIAIVNLSLFIAEMLPTLKYYQSSVYDFLILWP